VVVFRPVCTVRWSTGALCYHSLCVKHKLWYCWWRLGDIADDPVLVELRQWILGEVSTFLHSGFFGCYCYLRSMNRLSIIFPLSWRIEIADGCKGPDPLHNVEDYVLEDQAQRDAVERDV